MLTASQAYNINGRFFVTKTNRSFLGESLNQSGSLVSVGRLQTVTEVCDVHVCERNSA